MRRQLFPRTICILFPVQLDAYNLHFHSVLLQHGIYLNSLL
jgi:hypothetical protein